MEDNYPRIAFFTDCYYEVNGVALTSRQLESYASRLDIPILMVHQGPQTCFVPGDIDIKDLPKKFYPSDTVEIKESAGRISKLELKQSPLRIKMDRDFYYDPLMWRNVKIVRYILQNFRPDAVHITSCGDIGQLGAYFAKNMKFPLVASWHTNLHEFAAHRLGTLLNWLPEEWQAPPVEWSSKEIWKNLGRFYALADLLLAPNPDLAAQLGQLTRKPVRLMERGVDTTLFSASYRTKNDGIFRIGYVGRIEAEKNLRCLADIEKGLNEKGISNYRYVLVGDGYERAWLEQNLHQAEFTGVLKGNELSAAYANFDLFIFPSLADTFGNVVLEALASEVPAAVSNKGGPQYIVEDKCSGFVCESTQDFIDAAFTLISNPETLNAMRKNALERAKSFSWDNVFQKLFTSYQVCIESKKNNTRVSK